MYNLSQCDVFLHSGRVDECTITAQVPAVRFVCCDATVEKEFFEEKELASHGTAAGPGARCQL